MKLGAAMGEMSKPSKGGATKEALCTSDADCSDNETCKSGNCVNVCSPSPCPSDEFCLNKGNHSYSCVECTSNDQCGDREICKNNACYDACTNNPCSSKNQACSSQDGHSYICYGCVNNNACSNGKVCDASSKSCVCPSGYADDGNGGCKSTDPCEGVTCPYAHICSAGKCVADCPGGYSFDNSVGECIADCDYQKETTQCPIEQYQIYDYNSQTVRCQDGQGYRCTYDCYSSLGMYNEKPADCASPTEKTGACFQVMMNKSYIGVEDTVCWTYNTAYGIEVTKLKYTNRSDVNMVNMPCNKFDTTVTIGTWGEYTYYYCSSGRGTTYAGTEGNFVSY